MDPLGNHNDSYYFPPGSQGGQGWRAANGGDAERTGLLVEIPSPTRGLRRNLSGRPGHSMGRVRGTSQIHPIDELEEEPDSQNVYDNVALTRQSEMAEKRTTRGAPLFDTAAISNPFTDAHGRDCEQQTVFHSAPTSPTLQEFSPIDHVTPNWLQDTDIVSERRSSVPNERLSPDKSTSERTSSNLSESSTRSNLSWASSSAGAMRNASIRSAAILNSAVQANPFRSPNASPTRDRPRRNSDNGRKSPFNPQTHSFSSIRSNGYADIDSFRTAQSSFPHLQAEGEALLGGNPERYRPGTSSSHSNTYRDTEGSNSRAATSTPATSLAMDTSAAFRPVNRERRKSWLGSVRRVLTRSTSGAERTRSLTTTMSYYEPYRDNPVTTIDTFTADNRKSFPAASAPPRRAASDASFWRSRRGKHDWLDEEQDPTWRRNAGDDWGAPEDIAMAERERQRQEWRERGALLVNIANDDQQLPTPRTPIGSHQLGVQSTEDRPCTPASEADWDVEAAVERRVVLSLIHI